MRRAWRLLGLVLVLVHPGLAGAGADEDRVQFGGELSFADSDNAVADGFGIGARVELPLAELDAAVRLSATFDYYFPDSKIPLSDSVDLSYWELNGNLTYGFDVGESVRPYVGGGLNLARGEIDFGQGVDESDTSVGLNLLGGIRIPTGSRITPFVEVKKVFGGDFEPIAVTGGILF